MNARVSLSVAVFHRLCTEPTGGALLPPDSSQFPRMLTTTLAVAADEDLSDTELGELARALLVELDRLTH